MIIKTTAKEISAAFAHNINTVQCTVKFRLSKENAETVRRYYNMDPTRPMFSRTITMPQDLQFEGIESPEVFAIGNGWYIIYGDGIHRNSALRCLAMIEVALRLKVRPQQTTPEVKKREQEVREMYAGRRVVVNVLPTQIVNGSKDGWRRSFTVVSRAHSAANNKVNVLREEARKMAEMRERESHEAIPVDKLKLLQEKINSRRNC